MTGLSKRMREDTSLMMEVSKKTIIPPAARFNDISKLVERSQSTPLTRQWHIGIDPECVMTEGVVLEKPTIQFGCGQALRLKDANINLRD